MMKRFIKEQRLAFISGLVFLLSLTWPVAYAQTLGTGDPIEPPIARLIIGLVICIALAIGIIVLLKKLKTNPRTNFGDVLFKRDQPFDGTNITIRQTKRISPHADVCLIEYGQKEFLVLVSPNRFLLLEENILDHLQPSKIRDEA